MLVLLYNREGRYDDALRTIDELQRRFPRNRLLWLSGLTAGGGGCPAGRARSLSTKVRATRPAYPRPTTPGEERARRKMAYDAALRAPGQDEAEE